VAVYLGADRLRSLSVSAARTPSKGVKKLRQQLNIVHIARSPVGGIFRCISDLATTQHAAGHAVGLICDSTSGGTLEEERIAALKPGLSLGVARIPMARSIGLSDLPTLLSVSRALAPMRPDVVHAHGAKGGVYGRLAAFIERRKGRHVASFYAPHGGSLHYERGSLSGRVYFSVERALELLTDGLIHVSAFEAETYRQKIGTPRCPAHVVRNGLRPEEFEPVAPADDPVDFLFIGELRELKGVDLFIEALAMLWGEGRWPRALIVGPSTENDLKRYRDLANEKLKGSRVAFLPPMPARKAFSLARNVVLPSRAESLPYLVLEVAAAGIPLIATNVGGIPEIFAGEAERLVRPGDAGALATAMRSALTAPETFLAQAMSRRVRVKQKFSLAATASRIEEIYRDALEARYSLGRAGAVAEADASR
jgi:glycosyltransferase involved in cell wall biosynthesis